MKLGDGAPRTSFRQLRLADVLRRGTYLVTKPKLTCAPNSRSSLERGSIRAGTNVGEISTSTRKGGFGVGMTKLRSSPLSTFQRRICVTDASAGCLSLIRSGPTRIVTWPVGDGPFHAAREMFTTTDPGRLPGVR